MDDGLGVIYVLYDKASGVERVDAPGSMSLAATIGRTAASLVLFARGVKKVGQG